MSKLLRGACAWTCMIFAPVSSYQVFSGTSLGVQSKWLMLAAMYCMHVHMCAHLASLGQRCIEFKSAATTLRCWLAGRQASSNNGRKFASVVSASHLVPCLCWFNADLNKHATLCKSKSAMSAAMLDKLVQSARRMSQLFQRQATLSRPLRHPSAPSHSKYGSGS